MGESGRDYFRLVRALEHACDFTMLLAACDSEDLRRELTHRCSEVLSEHGIEVINVDLAGADDPLSQLVRSCPTDRGVLMAYGLERPEQHDPNRLRNLLQGMNLQRERYRDKLTCPVVFWLYKNTLAEMATYAPDFYDWRSGLYFFESEVFDDSVAREVSYQLSSMNGVPNLPLPEARKRLANLQDLLVDLRTARQTPQNREALFRTAARIIPLLVNCQLYDNAVQLASDMSDRAQHEAQPVWQAAFENNLGNAYRNLPTGERGENLQRAMACCEAALQVRTQDAFPVEWAETTYNLGLLYLDPDFPGGRAENAREAVKCLDAALRVFTEEAFPQYHADAVATLEGARELAGD